METLVRVIKFSALLIISIALATGALAAASSTHVKLQIVDRADLPCDIDAISPLDVPELSLALGEYEHLALLVTTAAPFGREQFHFRGLPRGVAVETRVATPHRRRLRGNQEATQPFLVEAAPSVDFQTPGKRVYWLTFHAGPQVKPGRHSATIRLRDASVPLTLTVHPFRLRRDPKVFYGAFCGAKDTEITPQHMVDLHQRGFDALQFFWGSVSVPIENDNGRTKVDFSRMDRWMSALQQAGMKGPVVWSLGNYISSHLENRLSEVFGIPRPAPVTRKRYTLNFSDIHNPELNRRLRDAMLAIRDQATAKKWPEIIFLIYDEPTIALMEEHENRYKFIKSFWPELRIYGVTMDRLALAESIAHMVDIFVSNGDFERISAFAAQTGKPFWLYGSASGNNEVALRRRYAWTAWAHNATAVWFWAYNYHAGDPYDDFDGRSADSSMSVVWPPRTPGGPLVYSVSWDGMREAVDDMAYIQTLEWVLGRSRSSRAREIQLELENIKQAVASATRESATNRVEAKQFVTRSRRSVAGWIEELLRSDKKLLDELRLK